MSEKESNEQPKQEQTSTEPNRDVSPPKVQFVLNHAIPEVDKGQHQINESREKDSKK